MTTDTYITRLEDLVKHPEMMPDLSSIRGDIACLLAKCRELEKQFKSINDLGLEEIMSGHPIMGPAWKQRMEAEHTYECAKRE